MAVHVLDANIILRYLLADHAGLSQRAAALMQKVRDAEEGAFIPESVIAETVYVLVSFYGVPRPEISRWLIEILSYRGVAGDRPALVSGALRVFSRSGISIADALTLMHAEQAGYQISTFDKKLARLAARRRPVQ